jgi:hypothetical protein
MPGRLCDGAAVEYRRSVPVARRQLRALFACVLPVVAIFALVPPAGASNLPHGARWEKTECRPFTTGAARTSSTCGATLDGGRAVAPAGAPEEVRDAIAAANHIRGRPYVWGGGHRAWASRGYDCSGAVGFSLHAAGLLDHTMVSGELAWWGEGGTGRWITVYANDHHVYMVVAGLRFDTRDPPPGVTGPRWHPDMPRDPTRKFTARHPTGL